jgi:enoyl-[acyl-carrier-protein] reductase (NADH)
VSRLGTSEDRRVAAVSLLSDMSSFMTGAALRIDSGHAAQ